MVVRPRCRNVLLTAAHWRCRIRNAHRA